MNKRNIIYPFFAFVIAAILIHCNKPDSYQEKTIKGRLFLNDTVLKKGILVPQAGVEILLSYSTNFSDYIFKTKTEADGSFSFNYQPVDDKPLHILAKTVVNTVTYTGIGDAANFGGSGSLIMLPQIGNGLKITAFDPANSVLPGTTICLFTSQPVYGLYDCGLAIRTQTANETGAVFFNDLPPNNYLILAKTTIGLVNFRWTGPAVNVSSTGITAKDVALSILPPVSPQNGFELLIRDNQQTPVNGAAVYGYRSRAIYLIDTAHLTPVFNLSTSNNGVTGLYNIDPVRYYLRVVKQVGGTTLKSMDSIDVNVSGIVKDTVVIQ